MLQMAIYLGGSVECLIVGRISLSELEHEEYLRQGCKFAGRCPDVMDICMSQEPKDVYVGNVFKCHKYTGDASPSANV
jgi:hypothetical protein